MAILSPDDALRAVRRGARSAARRVLGIPAVAEGELRRVPDDLPRDTLFAQPLVVTVAPSDDTERVEGGTRVTFRVLVRDAAGKRCSDVHVVARIDGPSRSATGETTTDMLGSARFRMTGEPGEYSIEVLDVAAGALEWDRDESTATATATVG